MQCWKSFIEIHRYKFIFDDGYFEFEYFLPIISVENERILLLVNEILVKKTIFYY